MPALDRAFAQQMAAQTQGIRDLGAGPETGAEFSDPTTYGQVRDAAYVSSMDHAQATNLENVLRGNPGLSPQGGYVGLVTGLPKDSALYQQLQQIDSQNSQAAAAKAAQDKATAQAKAQDDSTGGGWFSLTGGFSHQAAQDVYGVIKGTSRGVFSTLSSAGQLVYNTGTEALAGWQGHAVDPTAIYKGTDLGALVTSHSKTGKWDTGSGFFMGGDAAKTQAEESKRLDLTPGFYNNATGGAITPGSEIVHMFHGDVNSRAGQIVSGTLDFGARIADPTMFIGVGEVRAGLAATREVATGLAKANGVRETLTAARDAATIAHGGAGTVIARGMGQAREVTAAKDAASAFDATRTEIGHRHELIADLTARQQGLGAAFHSDAERLINDAQPILGQVTSAAQKADAVHASLKAAVEANNGVATADALRQAGFVEENQIRDFIHVNEQIPAEREALLAERDRLAAEAPKTETPQDGAAPVEGEQAVAEGQAAEHAAGAPATRLAEIDKRLAELDKQAQTVLDSLPAQTQQFLGETARARSAAGFAVDSATARLQVALDEATKDLGRNSASLQEQIDAHMAAAEESHRMGLRIAQEFAEANGHELPDLSNEDGIRSWLERLTGIYNTPDGGKVTDLDRALNAVTGGHLEPVTSAMAKISDPAVLWDLTRGKLGAGLVAKIADASTPDAVRDILIEAVSRGELDETVGSLRVLRSIANKVGDLPAETVATEMYRQMGLPRRVLKWSNDAARRKVPWSYDMHVDDVNAMVGGIADYINFVMKGKSPKYAEFYREHVGAMLRAETGEQRYQAFNKTLNALHREAAAEHGIEKGSDAWNAMEKRFTWAVAKKQEARVYNADVRATQKGEPLEISGIKMGKANMPLIEAHLADLVHLPDPKEVKRIFASAKALERSPVTITKDALDNLFDKHWRTLVLTGRYNFVLRNTLETQVRMFLNGHPNALTHPWAPVAMMMTGKNSMLADLFKHVDLASIDVHGNTFAKRALTDDEAINGITDHLLKIMYDNHSLLDPGIMTKWKQFGFDTVEHTDPRFTEALAGTLQGFYHDQIGRDVMKAAYTEKMTDLSQGIRQYAAKAEITDPRDAVVGYYTDTKAGQVHVQRLRDSSKKLNSALSTREGIADWMFNTDNPLSIEARALAHNGGTWDPEIMKPLLDGEFSRFNLTDGADQGVDGGYKRTQALANLIETKYGKAIRKGDFPITRSQMPQMVEDENKANLGDLIAWANGKFFGHASAMEKAFAKVPEFRYAYWDHVADLISALKPEDAKALLETAREALPRKYEWSRATFRKIEGNARLANGSGHFDLSDIHDLAMAKAGKHVEKIFYNAGERNLLAYRLRLISPFGQAWANTLLKWGQLAAKNPEKVYRAAQLYNHAMQPGSNLIYQVTGTPYTPGEGFLHKDPTTGVVMLNIPLLGKGMSALAGALGAPSGLPMLQTEATSPLSSFNLAFQQSILPGLGPVAQLPFSMVDGTDWYQKAPDWFKGWVAPFQDPSAGNQGFLESHMPAVPKAIFAWAGVPGFQTTATKYLGPIMGQLYSTNPERYSDPTTGMITPDGRKQLLDDATQASKNFTLSRMLMQQIDAGALSPNFFLQTGDAGQVAQSVYTKEFNDKIKELGSYDDAATFMLDKYGPRPLIGMVSAKTGANYADAGDWDFIKSNPDDAHKYPDIVTQLYADGEYSAAMQRYLNTNDLAGQHRSPDDIVDSANGILLAAQKSQINAKLVAGTITKDQAAAMNRALNNDFLGQTSQGDPTVRPMKIAELSKAVANSPAIASTPAGQAAAQYLAIRGEALRRIQEATGEEPNLQNPFQAQATWNMRDYLYSQGEALTQQYPDFNILWTHVLQNEVAP